MNTTPQKSAKYQEDLNLSHNKGRDSESEKE
jgi:hypothetical protein